MGERTFGASIQEERAILEKITRNLRQLFDLIGHDEVNARISE